MRTVEEIFTDIEKVKAQLPDGYTNTDLCELTAEAILSMFSDIPLDRLREILQAERDGRCVVLSTPMIPLMISDDEMDSDVYCPACGRSVSGGWDDYHTDQGWKLCQCPNCGQSIDDTKVISRADAEAALSKGYAE